MQPLCAMTQLELFHSLWTENKNTQNMLMDPKFRGQGKDSEDTWSEASPSAEQTACHAKEPATCMNRLCWKGFDQVFFFQENNTSVEILQFWAVKNRSKPNSFYFHISCLILLSDFNHFNFDSIMFKIISFPGLTVYLTSQTENVWWLNQFWWAIYTMW